MASSSSTSSLNRRRSHASLRVLLAAFLVGGALVVLAPRAVLVLLAHGDVQGDIGELQELPTTTGPRAAIVLGAGVRQDGSPTPILADRIDGGIELYDAGVVDVLVMSADNGRAGYDEPTAMRERAIDKGVPAGDVVADYGGRRTWDSCVRAREVFGLRDAIVVTSTFHAARAQVSCARAGVDTQVYAIDEDRFPWRSVTGWRTRELLASGRALGDLARTPDPAVGGERIDLGDRCARWRSLSPDDPLRGDDPCPSGPGRTASGMGLPS